MEPSKQVGCVFLSLALSKIPQAFLGANVMELAVP